MSLSGRSAVNQNSGDARHDQRRRSARRRSSPFEGRARAGTARARSAAPPSALQIASPRDVRRVHAGRAQHAAVEIFASAMNTGYPGGCGWWLRDVELAHAQREIDRVDVLERRRQQGQVRDQEDQAAARRAAEPLRTVMLDDRGAEAWQRVVQAAEAIAAQIDGDVRVAERAQLAIDRRRRSPARARAPSRRGRARDARWCRDAGRGRRGTRGRAAPSRPRSIVRSFSSVTSLRVRNPRRQAGGRGLVPRRHPGAPRQLADLRPSSARPRRAG